LFACRCMSMPYQKAVAVVQNEGTDHRPGAWGQLARRARPRLARLTATLSSRPPPGRRPRPRQLEKRIEHNVSVARELVAANKKERALLALKKKKMNEHQLQSITAYLLNVEDLVGPGAGRGAAAAGRARGRVGRSAAGWARARRRARARKRPLLGAVL
jgi:hypothetical protein